MIKNGTLLGLAQLFLMLGFVAAQVEAAPDTGMDSGQSDRIELELRGPKESGLLFGLDVQFVPVSYPGFEWAPGTFNAKSGQGVRIAWEWIPYAGVAGKLGLGIAGGYSKISGIPIEGVAPLTLEVIPLDLQATYRFHYAKNQLFVPFVHAGPEVHFGEQIGSKRNIQYRGLVFGGGLSLQLDYVDPISAGQLDSSTGINNCFLVVDIIRSQPLGNENTVNFARDEIRAGLRFEM